MNKKMVALLLIGCMSVSFVGCGEFDEDDYEELKPASTTSISSIEGQITTVVEPEAVITTVASNEEVPVDTTTEILTDEPQTTTTEPPTTTTTTTPKVTTTKKTTTKATTTKKTTTKATTTTTKATTTISTQSSNIVGYFSSTIAPSVAVNSINFQIYQIYEMGGKLYVDAYVTNGYPYNVYNINTITMNLTDKNGTLFASGVFPAMTHDNGQYVVLGYGETIKWTFVFGSSDYLIGNCDFSSVGCNTHYYNQY